MAWNAIIGQEKVKNLLQKAIIDNRIANSYCFWGLDGIGKDALAIEFAKSANCINPIIYGNTIQACDSCSSCKEITNLQSQSLEIIFSLPAGKTPDGHSDDPIAKLSDEQIDLIQEQIALKAENPYHKISIPNANQIKISSIRGLKKKLTLTSGSRGRRFVIISNADEMNSESANSFLKTLEEPHDNITIILTTSRPDTILPTILSRCQQVRCQPLPFEELAGYLMIKYGKEHAEARLIATFAQGSFSRAIGFLDKEMSAKRELVVEMLRSTVKKKTYRTELFNYFDEISKTKVKNNLDTILQLLLLWMRDVLACKMEGGEKTIINIDQKEIIMKFAAVYGKANIDVAIEEIEKAIKRINKNVQSNLLLISLFLKLRDILIFT